jgi:hypothetical protein
MRIGVFQNAVAAAKEELGREPSAVELADMTGLPIKEIERLQKEIQKDLSTDGLEDEISTETPREAEILTYIYQELNNDQRIVYDYMLGKHGKPRLGKPNGKIDFEGISARTGFSQSKVRMMHAQIKTKFEQASR